jgi:hypothetical protein
MTATNGTDPAAPSYPRRFRWPMRLFLFVLLFDIIFRSFSVLFPSSDWVDELEMDTYPWRLPTRAEMADLADREAAPGKPDPLSERVVESLDDVWTYLKPWPAPRTRAHITSWQQGGKFVFCWLNTRLEFLEHLAGIDEEWPMFSPNVSKGKWLTRSRLIYADGSEQVVRLSADPEDLTRYAHWNRDKVLNYEGRVGGDADNRLGYCNLLRHRHAVNESGSPLRTILIYWVHYTYPPPGVDPAAYLHEQMERSAERQDSPFYEYDVSSGQGRRLAGQ